MADEEKKEVYETESKLRTEINYLRRLIDAHKAIKDLQSNGKKEVCNSSIAVQSSKDLHKRSFVGTSWYNSGSIICHSQQKQTTKDTSTCHSQEHSSSSNSKPATCANIMEPFVTKISSTAAIGKKQERRRSIANRYRKRKLGVRSQSNNCYSWRAPNNSVLRKSIKHALARSKDFGTPPTATKRSLNTLSSSSCMATRRRKNSNLDSSLYNQGRLLHASPAILKRRQLKDSPIVTRYSLRKRKTVTNWTVKDSTSNKTSIDTSDSTSNNNSQSDACISALKTTPRERKRSYRYINGTRYLSHTNGRSLKRMKNSPGITIVSEAEAKSTSYSVSKTHHSKSTISNKTYNRRWLKDRQTTEQYCIFYNRFGHCNRGDKCSFIHDSKRIAVCNKFLRGICDKLDGSCPFSHNVSKEKMPVCAFFLRGLCTRENCPYLHVNLGSDAEVCQDFLKGFCHLAEKCKKRHDFRCLEFMKNGFCTKGKQCSLLHTRKGLRTKSSQLSVTKSKPVIPVKEPFFFKKIKLKNQRMLNGDQCCIMSPTRLITPVQLEYIPLQTNTESDFIPL